MKQVLCVWVDRKGIYTLIPRSVHKAESEKIRIKSGDTVSAWLQQWSNFHNETLRN